MLGLKLNHVSKRGHRYFSARLGKLTSSNNDWQIYKVCGIYINNVSPIIIVRNKLTILAEKSFTILMETNLFAFKRIAITLVTVVTNPNHSWMTEKIIFVPI